jgi:hypothetical protein
VRAEGCAASGKKIVQIQPSSCPCMISDANQE